MRNFKKCFLVLAIGTIVLTSATIAPKVTPFSPEKIAMASKAIDAAKMDGKISNAELRNIATVAKGEKLSLKEKIAIKLFGKKISNKIIEATNQGSSDGKSQLIALLLVLLVGGIGIHRFYLGYTWQGVVQLLTFGGCGVWTLIDLVRIITGDLTPKDDSYGSTL